MYKQEGGTRKRRSGRSFVRADSSSAFTNAGHVEDAIPFQVHRKHVYVYIHLSLRLSLSRSLARSLALSLSPSLRHP